MSANMSNGNEPFYTKDIVIILAILICGPIGIILMWLAGRWDTKTKLIVTIIWLLLNGFLIGRRMM